MSQLWMQAALSWSLTYLLHSTLLLGGAWLLVRALGRGRDAAKEWIWKTALVGGLLTSGLQVGLALDPALGRWSVFTTDPVPEAGGQHASLEGATRGARDGGVARDAAFGTGEVASGAAAANPAALPLFTRDANGQSAFTLTSTWRDGLLALWSLGAVLGALLLAYAWSRIADRLAGRRELVRGETVDLLRELSRRAGLPRRPRLCVSDRVTSPATIGVLLPQILVPQRALDDLAPAQQEAMLAHELAHIVRRDPQWSFVARLVERLCFLQPLNRVARKALAEIAEYRSDDWAVRHTGRELDLARCLTEVAGWRIEEREAVAVLPMAGRGSQLSERVQRLLHAGPPKKPKRASALALPAVTFGLVSTAFVLPGMAAEIDALTAEWTTELPLASFLEASPRATAIGDAPAPLVGVADATDTDDADVSLTDALTAGRRQVAAHLDALRNELALLESRIQAQGEDPELAGRLASLQGRFEALSARQARIDELLDRAFASDLAHTPSSDTETN